MAVKEYTGNLFPVDVIAPDGTEHLTCRVIASASGTTIWGWDVEARTGVPLFRSVDRPLALGPTGEYLLALSDVDEVVALYKRQGCACGHPMKRWVPPGPHTVGT